MFQNSIPHTTGPAPLVESGPSIHSFRKTTGGLPVFVAFIQREVSSELLRASAQCFDIWVWLQRLRDDVGHFGEFLCTKTTSCQRWSTDAQTGGSHRWTRIPRHRVAVDSNADLIEDVFTLFAV